jgi:surface antigen
MPEWLPRAQTGSENGMKKMSVGIVRLALVVCSTASDRDNIVATGTIFGTIAGALLGYELLGSGTGRYFTAALFGAGGAAGAYFAAQKFLPAEMAQINDAGYESLATLPIGATSEWSNAETRGSGSFTPTREFTSRNGQPCSEIQAVIRVAGEEHEMHQKACQTVEGTWVTI